MITATVRLAGLFAALMLALYWLVGNTFAYDPVAAAFGLSRASFIELLGIVLLACICYEATRHVNA